MGRMGGLPSIHNTNLCSNRFKVDGLSSIYDTICAGEGLVDGLPSIHNTACAGEILMGKFLRHTTIGPES